MSGQFHEVSRVILHSAGTLQVDARDPSTLFIHNELGGLHDKYHA